MEHDRFRGPGWAGADEAVIDDRSSPETLRERIGGTERRMFLAVEGGRVVGFAATRWKGVGPAELVGMVVLQEIVVLQEMVGREIETPQLHANSHRRRDDGAMSVWVRTEADNERALGFYRGRGRGFGGERRVVEDVGGTDIVLTELRRPLDE